MIANLYDAWKQSRALKYESLFHEPIVNSFCQWQSATDNGRDEKGRIFNAGYEVFIYAFFIGLYKGERRPLSGSTKSFSMEIFRLGDVKEKNTTRTKYTKIQRYIFAALVAQSDINLVEYDKGNLSTEDAVSTLMTTLNEYANGGFYFINDIMDKQNDF
ncbi:MAG: hypothetical protein PUD22_02445, partial [Erysipelotrichaceae bacterium]|nr:hypothetical protein [Erysipelotrichaceae bacterium]